MMAHFSLALEKQVDNHHKKSLFLAQSTPFFSTLRCFLSFSHSPIKEKSQPVRLIGYKGLSKWAIKWKVKGIMYILMLKMYILCISFPLLCFPYVCGYNCCDQLLTFLVSFLFFCKAHFSSSSATIMHRMTQVIFSRICK